VTLDHAFCDYLPSWKIKKKEWEKQTNKKSSEEISDEQYHPNQLVMVSFSFSEELDQ